VNSFRRGLVCRSPLILLAALALLVPAVLAFEALFTSGRWTAVPLEYALRNPQDSFTYVSWVVGRNRVDPPDVPAVYLLGGSSAREAIVDGESLAAEVLRSGGPAVKAYDLGSNNQTTAEGMAVVDTVPDSPAWVLVGVNLGRFTADRRTNAQQVRGREFLLKSRALRRFVSAEWGLERTSFTILPGVFAYLTDWVKRDGARLFSGRPVRHEYQLHRYTESRIRSDAQKDAMVDRWLEDRRPVFERNLGDNLALLERLLELGRERGVRIVLVELPLNQEVVGGRFDEVRAAYQAPVRRLARSCGAEYLDFNEELAIPSTAFRDLSHLVEPGREAWQRRLAEELARLMTTDEDGGDVP
jgi:hypothetical protein